jgi:hypothetical protein
MPTARPTSLPPPPPTPRHRWSLAIYGVVMAVAMVLGLPLGVYVLLARRRRTLFGPAAISTRRRFGFLYEAYGPTAWWWETEELVRKLLLTAGAALLDAGSPLQVWGAGAHWSPSARCQASLV